MKTKDCMIVCVIKLLYIAVVLCICFAKKMNVVILYKNMTFILLSVSLLKTILMILIIKGIVTFFSLENEYLL